MTDDFADITVLDNFYQTSSFFPMPVILVSTVAESGVTNLGPYSLCFPHLIAGKRGMMLITQVDSKTALNIERTGVCALNFIPDDKKFMQNCVMLGYPGETTEEKMPNSIFTLMPSTRSLEERQAGVQYPEIIIEAIQVFECTWDNSYPVKFEGNDSEAHYLLIIDKIVMKERWQKSLYKGKGFPRLPVCFGFRDNVNFWFSRHSRPFHVPIPKSKAVNVNAIRFAVDRYDPSIEWQDEACAMLVNVPRPFLTRVIGGCVDRAKEQGVTLITPEFLASVRDKRSG